MNYTEIVKKLIGNIQPAGDTAIDEERFENLKQMCQLVDNLLKEIDEVAYRNRDAHQHSIKRAVEYIDKFESETLGIN